MKIVGENELRDGLSRRPIELAVEIAGDGIHAFKKILAERFEVGSFGSRLHLIYVGARRGEVAVEVRQFGVEARELELRRGRKPIHGA